VNKCQIRAFIKETFNDRENMRNANGSAAAIIARYPKLVDYRGEMVKH
jgi:hypothetical protein